MRCRRKRWGTRTTDARPSVCRGGTADGGDGRQQQRSGRRTGQGRKKPVRVGRERAGELRCGKAGEDGLDWIGLGGRVVDGEPPLAIFGIVAGEVWFGLVWVVWRVRRAVVSMTKLDGRYSTIHETSVPMSSRRNLCDQLGKRGWLCDRDVRHPSQGRHSRAPSSADMRRSEKQTGHSTFLTLAMLPAPRAHGP